MGSRVSASSYRVSASSSRGSASSSRVCGSIVSRGLLLLLLNQFNAPILSKNCVDVGNLLLGILPPVRLLIKYSNTSFLLGIAKLCIIGSITVKSLTACFIALQVIIFTVGLTSFLFL